MFKKTLLFIHFITLSLPSYYIKMTFTDLNIIEPILHALEGEGYSNPTPIQELAIPILLQGRDLLGCAQTGTGKTAAFAIPMIQMLNEYPQTKGRKKVRALIVTPTRELALQIGENFTSYSQYTNITNTVIFGGVKQGSQTKALRQGVDVIVATPGRLLDLIGQGFISLKDIKYFALDEADQMLEMGFIHDIRKIIARLPKQRQSLFFSATMPPKIVSLAGDILGNPEKVTIKPQQATAERVEQGLYFVGKSSKTKLLVHLINEKKAKSLLVFSRTKHGANRIVKNLESAGIHAAAIHGNKSQAARQKALGNFKEGNIKVLVATDIAARGIDVDSLELVINYELPNIPETYVHRIGRTGRAQASGIALSFCDEEEKAYLKDIQKLIKQSIPVIEDHPFSDEVSSNIDDAKGKPSQRKPQRKPQRDRKPQNSRGRSGNSNSGRGSSRTSSKSEESRSDSRRRRPSSRTKSTSSSNKRTRSSSEGKKDRLF